MSAVKHGGNKVITKKKKTHIQKISIETIGGHPIIITKWQLVGCNGEKPISTRLYGVTFFGLWNV